MRCLDVRRLRLTWLYRCPACRRSAHFASASCTATAQATDLKTKRHRQKRCLDDSPTKCPHFAAVLCGGPGASLRFYPLRALILPVPLALPPHTQRKLLDQKHAAFGGVFDVRRLRASHWSIPLSCLSPKRSLRERFLYGDCASHRIIKPKGTAIAAP